MTSDWQTLLLAVGTGLATLALLGAFLWWRRGRKRLPKIPAPGPDGLVAHLDVPYVSEEDAHPVRHRLDVFAPAGAKGLPVLLFIHGGGWSLGHKSWSMLGQYNRTGRTFAKLGLVVVMPNYRLSPWVRHPEHIRDVARAFAWARTYASRYGGDPRCLFVGGHSSGGHLAALLATDGSYLQALGESARSIRGCLVVSGVFRIGDFVSRLAAVPIARFFGAMVPVFGGDEAVRAAASPISHVTAGMPPFLVVYGDREWYGLDRQAEEFVAAATAARARIEVQRIPGRSHVSIIAKARHADDPVVRAAAAFIDRHRS